MTAVPLRRLALYAGGFLGPFGAVVIIPMFPELRSEFGASSGAVNLGFSLYLIPFALTLLFSGTVGERYGRRRVVRATYVAYAVASVAVALAPNLALFVVARGLQGVANAFITPLLVAGLAEMVPEERFGREVGIYSSFQALGGGLGPVVGGLAADTAWQGAFVGTAVVAAALALMPPDGEPRGGSAAPTLRPLLTRRMVALGVALFLAAAGPIGVAVLVGVAARDVLDLNGTTTGLILLGGSLSAMVLGPVWGRLIERWGAPALAAPVLLASSAAAALLALGTTGWALGGLWLVGGASASLVAAVFQALGATIMPDNRGGALSFLLSFRFLGHAAGPLLFVPFMESSAAATLVAAASLGLVAIVAVRVSAAPVS